MIDPILLEVLWNRLISIVNEQAAALIHSSFTTVVREAGDLSAGVFDAEGHMLAQAVTGTPGHINTMANCVRESRKWASSLSAVICSGTKSTGRTISEESWPGLM